MRYLERPAGCITIDIFWKGWYQYTGECITIHELSMTEKEIAKSASLLRNGQPVKIDGNWFKAIQLFGEEAFYECHICKVDSLCHGNVNRICWELDPSHHTSWILELIQ